MGNNTLIGIAGALGAAGGMALMIVLGSADPGKAIVGDSEHWTWTPAQADMYLRQAATDQLHGTPVASVHEFVCKNTGAEWECAATYERQIAQEDLPAAKAAAVMAGKTLTILDVRAK